MIGAGLFGDLVFGDIADLSPVRRRARGVGGSGFPADWNEIITANARQAERERRRLERELETITALVAAGVL